MKPPFLISLFRQWRRFITSTKQRKEYGLKNNILLSTYIYKQYFGKNSPIPTWNLRILNYSQLFSLLNPFWKKVEIRT